MIVNRFTVCTVAHMPPGHRSEGRWAIFLAVSGAAHRRPPGMRPKYPMMKFLSAFFREAGSLTAGFLIGLAVVASVFAMTIADPGEWQAIWVLSTPIILALGLALQVVVTFKPRLPRTTGPKAGVVPVRLTELSHQR